MKLIFSPEEVSKFLQKKNNEIGGDNTLNSILFKDAVLSVNSLQSMMEAVYEIASKQGRIEGRQQMLLEFLEFFEIQKEK